jgi:peptide/nickel transport system substrate-binding protein
VRRTPRSAKILALLAGTALLAAACGSDDDGGGASETTAAAATEAPATEAPAGSEAPSSEPAGGEVPAGGMTLTIHLNPDAVWDDGTPITSKDLECSWKAALNTPGSLVTTGYDKITAIDTSDPQTAVVTFSEPYAAYKNLFSGPGASVLKADNFANCEDISGDMLDSVPFSGRPWKQESWSPDQQVLVPNENYWVEEDKPIAERVVMVPKADSDTEINSLKSGEVGMIFPQAFAGITDALNDPNIKYTPGYGTNYEALYFEQSKGGPFSDPIFREAFSKSVDRELILKSIYEPIFPGSELLQCGLWVPTVGPWCDNTQFENSYDPAAAEALLTENGWAKDASGFWAKDGTAPTIRWMVNTGNKRREDTQALMIPDFAAKGFNVVADNSDADTVFQKRLPGLDYDLAMFISTASPDPTVTAIMSCDQIPSPENNNQGQSLSGYCNEDASALMAESDREVDENARADLIHQIGQYLVDDSVMLPLYQFPNIAAWRTDQVGGPVDEWAGNYMSAFKNLNKWEPVGGSEIIIGAEQWPDCLNPVTECTSSSWMVWTAAFPLLPAVWDTTAEGYEPTALVTEEPTVELG